MAFIALLAAVAWWVSRAFAAEPQAGPQDLAGLELEHEMRLTAVRDAELDAQVGKISKARHRELDAALRDEALAAMRKLEEGRRQAGQDG